MKSRIDNAVRTLLGRLPRSEQPLLNQLPVLDLEDQVIDAVTDLIHLCAQYDLDWERVTDQAEWHFDQDAAEGEVQ